MQEVADRVNNWEIRGRRDGGFAVYDSHGMLAGPFGSKLQAIQAALKLPKPAPDVTSRRSQRFAHA